MKSVKIDWLPLQCSGGSLSHFQDRKLPVSTGCVDLDEILGGGWPRHEVSYIQGDAGAGKSSLCASSVISHLENGGDLGIILTIAGEHPLPGFSDRVHGKNAVILTLSLLEASSPVLELLDSARDSILVVDDLTSLSHSVRGVTWKPVKEFLAKIRPHIRYDTTILLVNQVRDTESGMVGALAHNYATQSSTVCVHMAKQEQDSSGLSSVVTVLTPPELRNRTCEIRIRYGYGVVG